MEKATFRLPDWQLQRMRQRSREERRSLNAVVADVIARGLDAPAPGETPSETARALGPLLLRPARSADGSARPALSPVRLTGALDWTRDGA